MANSLTTEKNPIEKKTDRPFRVLIAVSGSISAYKIADLVSLFKKSTSTGGKAAREIEVKCMLTESALQFVSPLVLETLSGNPALSQLFGPSVSGTEHIRLARWPDLIIFAPASAHLLARLSLGLADDLITTVALACEPSVPWLVAPAMNTVMWNQTVTQEHVGRLRARGAEFIEPARGVLACGEEGEGKLAAVEDIFKQSLLTLEKLTLENLKLKKSTLEKSLAADFDLDEPQFDSHSRSEKIRPVVLITAGPTTTRIDSVRYITNPSTGKMGAAMAEEFLARGYDVIHVLGIDKGVVKPRAQGASKLTVLSVTTAEEMLETSMKHLDRVQGVVATAAVMDYRVKATHEGKLKRSTADSVLELTPSVDVLGTLRDSVAKSKQWFFGFAAEIDDLEKNGVKKLNQKKLDFLFVNPVEKTGFREESEVGFASNANEGLLLFKDGRKMKLSSTSKPALARAIYQAIEKDIAASEGNKESEALKKNHLNLPDFRPNLHPDVRHDVRHDSSDDCEEHEFP